MKKRIVSGIKPSGDLHIGNYLGAIAQWTKLQDEYETMLFIADLHAITVPQKPEELRRRTLEIAKIYLAAGIDPNKVTIFVQSQIHEHAELCWILNTITKNGDLTKMTQFKDKSGFDIDQFEKIILNFIQSETQEESRKELILEMVEKIKEGILQKGIGDKYNVSKDSIFQGLELGLDQGMKIGTDVARNIFIDQIKEQFNSSSVGLFDYPVLMAGDIMMYDAQFVPVGDDQVQHIELTRTLGRRFNKRFGQEIFTIPQPLLQESGARIMALDNPSKKMSKSAVSDAGYIALGDTPEQARKKIMRAVTDSGMEIVYTDDKPALKNLINIYALFSGQSTAEIETLYHGKGYADFKTGLADVVVAFLTDFQSKYAAISDEEVMTVLRDGAQKARLLAQKKIEDVKKVVGFVV